MAFFGSKIRSHYAADQMNHIPKEMSPFPASAHRQLPQTDTREFHTLQRENKTGTTGNGKTFNALFFCSWMPCFSPSWTEMKNRGGANDWRRKPLWKKIVKCSRLRSCRDDRRSLVIDVWKVFEVLPMAAWLYKVFMHPSWGIPRHSKARKVTSIFFSPLNHIAIIIVAITMPEIFYFNQKKPFNKHQCVTFVLQRYQTCISRYCLGVCWSSMRTYKIHPTSSFWL